MLRTREAGCWQQRNWGGNRLRERCAAGPAALWLGRLQLVDAGDRSAAALPGRTAPSHRPARTPGPGHPRGGRHPVRRPSRANPQPSSKAPDASLIHLPIAPVSPRRSCVPPIQPCRPPRPSQAMPARPGLPAAPGARTPPPAQPLEAPPPTTGGGTAMVRAAGPSMSPSRHPLPLQPSLQTRAALLLLRPGWITPSAAAITSRPPTDPCRFQAPTQSH